MLRCCPPHTGHVIPLIGRCSVTKCSYCVGHPICFSAASYVEDCGRGGRRICTERKHQNIHSGKSDAAQTQASSASPVHVPRLPCCAQPRPGSTSSRSGPSPKRTAPGGAVHACRHHCWWARQRGCAAHCLHPPPASQNLHCPSWGRRVAQAWSTGSGAPGSQRAGGKPGPETTAPLHAAVCPWHQGHGRTRGSQPGGEPASRGEVGTVWQAAAAGGGSWRQPGRWAIASAGIDGSCADSSCFSLGLACCCCCCC